MQYDYVKHRIEGNIAVVTINNPPVNALISEAWGELDQIFDKLFAPFVGGMSFTGKDELHRVAGILQERQQTLAVTEQQRAPFVGGETAGKADGQHIRTQDL